MLSLFFKLKFKFCQCYIATMSGVACGAQFYPCKELIPFKYLYIKLSLVSAVVKMLKPPRITLSKLTS